jgi:hypothetical protein
MHSSHPHKGARERRNVPHTTGELLGSFRGLQVVIVCAAPADAFRIGSG